MKGELLRLLRRGQQAPVDRCPPDWMLTRHVSGEAPDAGLTAHLAACARCTAECAALEHLVTQAQRHIRAPELRPAVRRAIAARLLALGEGAPVGLTWRRVLAGAAAVMVIVVAALVGGRNKNDGRPRAAAPAAAPAMAPAPEASTGHAPVAAAAPVAAPAATPPATQRRSRATIRAIGAARFTRTQAPPDDVVHLSQGAIVLEVAPLAPGERFRVRTDDAEVEVRGTRFQVTALHGKLTAVSVSSGRVEVRSPGGGHVVLEPGDEWRRDTKEPAAGRAAKVEAPATPAPAFTRAWSLLRQGHAREAAELFAESERTARDGASAEDALYWRAVAMTKAGDRTQAQELFERFLRTFPQSSRAGEASAALGWLYIETGQPAAARRAFGRAATDPSAAVQASARDGLRRAAEQ